MLLYAVRVKAVDPEDGIVSAVAYGIRTVTFGELRHPPQPKRAEGKVIEGR